mmetsp:Transcript_60184/g.183821  ORF Transcript_60184/g.183821 Transcript_60184/m.183821 type:complete len:320 (+) Transcript_60184:1020-1979(+)
MACVGEREACWSTNQQTTSSRHGGDRPHAEAKAVHLAAQARGVGHAGVGERAHGRRGDARRRVAQPRAPHAVCVAELDEECVRRPRGRKVRHANSGDEAVLLPPGVRGPGPRELVVGLGGQAPGQVRGGPGDGQRRVGGRRAGPEEEVGARDLPYVAERRGDPQRGGHVLVDLQREELDGGLLSSGGVRQERANGHKRLRQIRVDPCLQRVHPPTLRRATRQDGGTRELRRERDGSVRAVDAPLLGGHRLQSPFAVVRRGVLRRVCHADAETVPPAGVQDAMDADGRPAPRAGAGVRRGCATCDARERPRLGPRCDVVV